MAEPFQYAMLRVVPRAEREEFVNVGVIVFCRTRSFLRARVEMDLERVRALCTDLDLGELREHLLARIQVAAGDPDAGPIAAMPQSERFGWLVAPSSTVIQASPVHTGLCDDPQAVLDRLFDRLVAAPRK